MKNKWKVFFKTVIISAMCCVVFIGVGFFYLDSQIDKPANNKVTEVPYAFTPQSKGVLFDISGNKTLIFLNFEEKSVTVIGTDYEFNADILYGYSIDFTVEADFGLLGGIIDTVGGIELENMGEELCFTGTQVVEILTTTPHAHELKIEIIKKILSKIAQNGFFREDFLYIIENSKTNLTVPDCYYWQDSMDEICKTVRIIS